MFGNEGLGVEGRKWHASEWPETHGLDFYGNVMATSVKSLVLFTSFSFTLINKYLFDTFTSILTCKYIFQGIYHAPNPNFYIRSFRMVD